MIDEISIGADLREDADGAKGERLLKAFRNLLQLNPNARLYLARKRQKKGTFSVLNWIELSRLSNRIAYFPYFNVCDDFPVKKADCDGWIDDETPTAVLTATGLQAMAADRSAKKLALFLTSFHPAKREGNSANMRQWLHHLRGAGYRIHLLYYGIDATTVSADMRERDRFEYDLFVDVPVSTDLVNRNQNGLNVHVDDWCGEELLEATSDLVRRYSYDVAVVNYPFISATMTRLPAYTRRILFTHDSFADRNRRMIASGLPESGWVSIDISGEALACRRADTIVAMQDEEAAHYRTLIGQDADVRVVSPIMQGAPRLPRTAGHPLVVGTLGSSNWVNEYNLTEFLKLWAKSDVLRREAKLLVGGGMSKTLANFAPESLMEQADPQLFGPVEQLFTFFGACDLFINPETGGTGIKIKTLESMAFGVPLLSTRAGAVGIGSPSKFHAATDLNELARLVEAVVTAPSLLEVIAQETTSAYQAYVNRHSAKMSELLGPMVDGRKRRTQTSRSFSPRASEPKIPGEVLRTASDYQLEEFRRIWSSAEISGKRVLEVGSDFHLVSARLFKANGAAEVVATNLGNWLSDEPLPTGVSFLCGDVADLAGSVLAAGSFDIAYGIAVLEHITDLDRVAAAVRKLLKPGGLAYFQGFPLWPGSLGHRVWISQKRIASLDSASGVDPSDDNRAYYDFSDPGKNPIPGWAHLTLDGEQLVRHLMSNRVPESHARAISDFVYNKGGRFSGSCSNFRSASEIISAFQKYFHVEIDRISHREPESPFFLAALDRYSETDLTTLGLRLFLSDVSQVVAQDECVNPTVSVIVPFYGVEDYIEACLVSILQQGFADFEVILVDDASPDGSRRIAERVAAVDDRVRIVTHQVNLGLGPARNTGAAHATGEYLLFLDSDDVMADTDSLRTLVAAARRTGAQVVTGSCDHLLPDGSIASFDRAHDKSMDGRPGQSAQGRAALRGALYFPGASYLPVRAWGNLIERTFYERLDLGFPATEHEDLAHTPILFFSANFVYYEPRIVVHYRVRPASWSRSMWSATKLQRYENLWRATRHNLRSHGLADLVGDCAIKMADHLMWKLEENGIEGGADEASLATLELMLKDAIGATNTPLVYQSLDKLVAARFFELKDRSRVRAMVSLVPNRLVIDYFGARLQGFGGVIRSSTSTPQVADVCLGAALGTVNK